MKKSDEKNFSSGGGKPAVAFSNQEAAKKNIETKIQYISAVCKKHAELIHLHDPASGETLALLEYLPNSKRTFNKLSTHLLSEVDQDIPDFGANSPDTLRGDAHLTKQVEDLIDIVTALRSPAQSSSKKEKKTAALKHQLAIAIRLRKMAEEAIYIQKKRITDLVSEKLALENQIVALQRECTTELSRLSSENVKLKEKLTPTQRAPAVVSDIKSKDREPR